MIKTYNINLNSIVILLAILFFSLPLIYWPGILEAASLPRYFSVALASSLGFIFWAVYSLNRTIPVVWHSNFWLVLGFFSWAAISTAWSPDPGTSLIEISQLASMITLAFLGMQLANNNKFKSLLIPALLAGSLVTALIGIGQHFGFNPFGLRLHPHNIASTFINRNHAAVYFDLIPPLAVASILLYKSPKYLTLSAASAGFAVAFLLINKSRGSLLALTVTIALFLILLITNKPLRTVVMERLTSKIRYVALALIIPLVIILIPISSDKQAEWQTSLLEQKIDSSSKARLNAYLNSLPLVAQQPMTGTGYGGFRMGYRPYSASLRPQPTLQENNVMGALHNDPLQYFVELGIPGGILMLLIFFATLHSAWPNYNQVKSNDKQIIKLGLLLAILAGGIHACVDFPLRLPTSAALFWFYLGSLLGLTAKQNNASTISPALKKFFIVLGAGSFLFTFGFYYHYFQGSHNLYIATARIQKNDCPTAITAIERSFSAFSLNYVTQNRYAQIYTVCDLPVETKLEAMNLVLAYDPTNVRARLTRGALYLEQNNVSEAEKDLLYVVDILPHRPLAYLALGDAAVLKHDYSAARHYYSASLKRDPNNSYAREMLNKLEVVN